MKKTIIVKAAKTLCHSICSTLMAISIVTLLLINTSCTPKFDAKDDQINIVLRSNIKGLDPIHAGDLYTNTVVTQVYEGLIGYHYLKRPVELVPLLAEAMPNISKDGLTYTFKLRKDVRFQDDEAFPEGKGRLMVAEDFVYSLKRLADPINRADGAWVIDGKIKGLNEWGKLNESKKADYNTPVEGLQATDPHTLVIKLTEPYYQLLYVLAMNFTDVVPREAVEKYGEEFLNHAVGTGPYRLKKWMRNSRIFFEKNPTFRLVTYPSEGGPGDKEKGLLEDAGKPLPLSNELAFTELPEDQPRWLNGLRGNFDYFEIPKDNFDNAIVDGELTPELKAKGIRLEISTDADVTFTSMNMTDPILGKHKKLRQAISMAYNSKLYIKKFRNGRASKALGPIPPDIDGYDPALVNPYSEFNIEKAKILLKEAGFPNGNGLPEFTYESLADTTARQSAEFFQQAMAKIGLKIKISSNTWPQFLEKTRKQQAQIFGMAWGADYPDGQNFLQLFYSKNASPGPNNSNYSNPEFDKLYDASLRLPPGEPRSTLYKQMVKILVEDAPWLFNDHRKTYYLIHSWVKNFKRNTVIPESMMYLKIDPKLRAEKTATF